MEECKHRRWDIHGTDNAYHGHCIDCGMQVPMWKLFNATREEMEEVMQEARTLIEQMKEV